MTRLKVTNTSMHHAIISGLRVITPESSKKKKPLFIRTAIADHIHDESFETFQEQVVQSNQQTNSSREDHLDDETHATPGTIFLNASDVLLNLGLKSYPCRYDSTGRILFPRFSVPSDPTTDALVIQYTEEDLSDGGSSIKKSKKKKHRSSRKNAKTPNTYRTKFALYIKLSDLRNFLTTHKKGSWTKPYKRKRRLLRKIDDSVLSKEMWSFWKKYPPPGTPVPIYDAQKESSSLSETSETSETSNHSEASKMSETYEHGEPYLGSDEEEEHEESSLESPPKASRDILETAEWLELSPRAYRDKFISGDGKEDRPIPLASASPTSLDERISIRLPTTSVSSGDRTNIPIHKRVIECLIPLANRTPERFLETLPNGISLEFSCVPVDYRSTRSSYNYIVSNSNKICFDATNLYGGGGGGESSRMGVQQRVGNSLRNTSVPVDGNMWMERPREVQETWVPSMRKTPVGDLLKWDSTFADIEYRMDPGVALLRADRTESRNSGKRKQRSEEEVSSSEEEASSFYVQSPFSPREKGLGELYEGDSHDFTSRGFFSSSDGEEDAGTEVDFGRRNPLLRLMEEEKQSSRGRRGKDRSSERDEPSPLHGISAMAMREEEEEQTGAELMDELDRLKSTKRKRQSKVTAVPNQRMYVPCISLDDLMRSGLLAGAQEALALICAKLIGLNKLKALRYLFPRLSKAEIARRKEAFNRSSAFTEFGSSGGKTGKRGRSKVVEFVIPSGVNDPESHEYTEKIEEYECMIDGIRRAISYYEFSSLPTSDGVADAPTVGSTKRPQSGAARDEVDSLAKFSPDDFSESSGSPSKASQKRKRSPRDESSLSSYYARTQRTTKSKLMQVRREFNVRRVDNINNGTCCVDSTGMEFLPVPYVCFSSLSYSYTKQTMANGNHRIRLPMETYTMIPIWLFPFVLRECKFDVLYEAMGSCVQSITHLTDLFDSAITTAAMKGSIPLEIARECRFMLHTSSRVFEYIERANVEMCLDELRSQNIEVNGCLSQICAAQKSLKEENATLRRHVEELEEHLLRFIRHYKSPASSSSPSHRASSSRAKKRRRQVAGHVVDGK